MRRIALVARHEVIETVRSRTYWIGLVITPVMFAIGLFVPSFLQRSFTPDRPVAIVDLSGNLAQPLREQIERRFARDRMATLYAHVRGFAKPDLRDAQGGLDPARVPLEFLRRSGDITDPDVDAFLAQGGVEAALDRARPLLRADAPPPTFDPQPFSLVDPPADLAAALRAGTGAELVRAYLSGERPLPPAAGAAGAAGSAGADQAGEGRTLYGVLVLPAGVGLVPAGEPVALGLGDGSRTAQLWTDAAPDEAVSDAVEGALARVLRRQALAAEASPELARRLAGLVTPFDTRLTSKADGASVTSRDVLEKNMPRVLSIALCFFLLGNLVILMTNTMEEKSNRIIEVLMSSITAQEMMTGKLLGASMVALLGVMFNVGTLMGVFFLASDGGFASFAQDLLSVLFGSPILLALLFYFIVGYFLFAGLFIAIGGLCETSKDVQSLSLPLQYFLILLPILIWTVANEPNGVAARVLSYIPYTSPIMMMARINADPGWFDLVATAVLQLVGIAATLWLSGRVFRAGALRTGKPPKLGELWGALRGQA
ncbi:ABC-2 family transporter [Rhodothalassium salexigens DSM 2132]|uniref:ABC-2 family transporter n=1 Tax=Rhodothalassium salexigens DSM 2132 TaxID=1188247 RepID=A0A4R2P766_RHOSA|nr:ABC transporter permease [Rhodothalassium salexigens]MBB4212632.1 ABC-type Na+ efflux pump permease subunit [Rhodothalassium salexigens DSM 2132]TCP30770.1 ABC-2 family transporter [Rhodothalassium salexigens DSM 2132]